MKYYSLFIHNNQGASTFTAALIHKIWQALYNQDLFDTALSSDYDRVWVKEPGEELVFESKGLCELDVHSIMRTISKQFPRCTFALRAADRRLLDVEVTYYKGSRSESRGIMDEWYSELW